MNQSLDVSTIVFAALAIFVVWKLRSVLGTRTGEERPPFNPFVRRDARRAERPTQPDAGNVITLPGAAAPAAPSRDPDRWKGFAEARPELVEVLDRIAAADPSFSGPMFIDGAKGAYEMILQAFAKGERKALSDLLARDVYEGFEAAIASREARKETLDHRMVSLDAAVIEDARLDGDTAQVTVRFESNQINAVRTADNKLADSSSDAVSPVIDHWTFTRTVSARDPNWTLSATSDA
jgi:predicted lipid-binding transport protein (Tim44 family)